MQTKQQATSIKVVARFRPQSEEQNGYASQYLLGDLHYTRSKYRRFEIQEPDTVIVLEEDVNTFNTNNTNNTPAPRSPGRSRRLSLPAGTRISAVEPRKFYFDRVFGPEATQEQVYRVVASPLVKSVLEGYNATILAYGQTGSGKTYTMMGPSSYSCDDTRRGITPRIAEELFYELNYKKAMNPDLHFFVKVSFIEIYQEKINDLISETKNLPLRESPLKGFYVENVSEYEVDSAQSIFEFLALGERNRHKATTYMNEASSRSHSIFVMEVIQLLNESKTRSKLYLVDLAGSEQVKKTGASGDTLEEAKHINTSLSTLGRVIQQLTEGRKGHIPYRDSVLTQILQESLGGNSKTVLIICCSSDLSNGDETKSTLFFGERAKKVQNKPVVNKEQSVQELRLQVQQLVSELLPLHMENTFLRAQLHAHCVNTACDLKVSSTTLSGNGMSARMLNNSEERAKVDLDEQPLTNSSYISDWMQTNYYAMSLITRSPPVDLLRVELNIRARAPPLFSSQVILPQSSKRQSQESLSIGQNELSIDDESLLSETSSSSGMDSTHPTYEAEVENSTPCLIEIPKTSVNGPTVNEPTESLDAIIAKSDVQHSEDHMMLESGATQPIADATQPISDAAQPSDATHPISDAIHPISDTTHSASDTSNPKADIIHPIADVLIPDAVQPIANTSNTTHPIEVDEVKSSTSSISPKPKDAALDDHSNAKATSTNCCFKVLKISAVVISTLLLIILIASGALFAGIYIERMRAMEEIDTLKFYHILGVPPYASRKQIDESYRKLIFQLHPDKNPECRGSQECARRLYNIRLAYALLTGRRLEHDYVQDSMKVNHLTNGLKSDSKQPILVSEDKLSSAMDCSHISDMAEIVVNDITSETMKYETDSTNNAHPTKVDEENKNMSDLTTEDNNISESTEDNNLLDLIKEDEEHNSISDLTTKDDDDTTISDFTKDHGNDSDVCHEYAKEDDNTTDFIQDKYADSIKLDEDSNTPDENSKNSSLVPSWWQLFTEPLPPPLKQFLIWLGNLLVSFFR